MIDLEKEVRTSLRQREVSAQHVEEESDEGWTRGQRLAEIQEIQVELLADLSRARST